MTKLYRHITRLILAVAAFQLAIIFNAPAIAVEPDEILENAELEARAREISRELRCVTCQSQSIDESNAPLAKDLRLVVRERVIAGDSNDEVIAFVTERYGDYVRLKPALRGDTMLLWLTPALALGGALIGAFFYFRQIQQKFDGNEEDDPQENTVA